MRGLCAECDKTVEGMVVPTEVDVCTFCQNSFHTACRRFQATPRRCEDCVKQLVERQKIIFNYKVDQNAEEFTKFFREDPKFEQATQNVPNIDIVNREDRNAEMIASMYFLWSMCNRPNCKTPWGKKKFQSFLCCPTLKYCSELCHSDHMIDHMQRVKDGAFGTTQVNHDDPEAGVFIKGHCANPKCLAAEQKTYRCQKCHLVSWCSRDCEHIFEPAHYTRCCKKKTPLKENGSMQHVM